MPAGIDVVSLPLSDTWTEWGELDDEGRRTLLARKYLNYKERVRTNPPEVYRAEQHTMELSLSFLDERDGGPEVWTEETPERSEQETAPPVGRG